MDALLEANIEIKNVAAWCRANGVQPRTFYRHRERVAAEGQWRERSRRPIRSPRQTCADLVAWICKLRADLAPDNGADFIRIELARIAARQPVSWAVPARSTINRELQRQGLLEPNPAKRPRSSWRRFAYARPRDCYQIDATTVRLADGRAVVVFEVLDDCSRLLVANHAAPAETAAAAIAAIRKAIAAHGAPALVLSDNGLAFTHRLHYPDGPPSRFARVLTAAGTRLIHSSPHHPQTCGKVERHHQTFKKWLAAQPRPPATLRQLQRLLDAYRTYYNTRRPHSALPQRVTPHQAWTAAAILGGPTALPTQTDAAVYHRPVYRDGKISVGTHRISVGRGPLIGTTVTVIRDGDHITIYTADGTPHGHATLNPANTYTSMTPL